MMKNDDHRTRSLSTRLERRSKSVAGTAHPSGRALTEVLLIAVIPCFAWLVWASLGVGAQAPWQAATAAASLNGPSRTVRDSVDLKDGRVLVVLRNGELRVWDENTKTEVGELSNSLTESACAAYSSTRHLLAVGSTDGSLGIWNFAKSDEMLCVLNADSESVKVCQFTPDERFLMTAGGAGEVKLWNTSTWTLEAVLKAPGDRSAIHSLVFSLDEKHVFVGTFSGDVHKWNLQDRSLERTIRASTSFQADAIVVGMIEIPERPEVAIATRGGRIAVWNHLNGQLQRECSATLPGIIDTTVTADRSKIICVDERGVVQSWDLTTGQPGESIPFASKKLRSLDTCKNGTVLLGGDATGNVEFAALK